MIKRPPEHAADADPLFIHPDDDAWDFERLDRERAALIDEHKAAKRVGPAPSHPWDDYQSGATRYDIEATGTIGSTMVSVREYLLPEKAPTVFHLRRVSGKMWARSAAAMAGVGGSVDQLWELCRWGLVKVTDGMEDLPDARWEIRGGEGGTPLTERDMQALFDAGHDALVLKLGWAVYHCSAPLTEAEGKH